jgi:hypothetical protein
MFNLLLDLTLNGFSVFGTNYGMYGYATSFNLISKPNYTLNFGLGIITSNAFSKNYMNFDFKYNKGSFYIHIIGSFPLNYNYVSNFR